MPFRLCANLAVICVHSRLDVSRSVFLSSLAFYRALRFIELCVINRTLGGTLKINGTPGGTLKINGTPGGTLKLVWGCCQR